MLQVNNFLAQRLELAKVGYCLAFVDGIHADIRAATVVTNKDIASIFKVYQRRNDKASLLFDTPAGAAK